MDELDSFTQNIYGVADLVRSEDNKTTKNGLLEEGVQGEEVDVLALDMTEEELLIMRDSYETKSAPYDGEIHPRQEKNKRYYKGTQGENGTVIPSNLIFEAEETFIPQALSKNPEPVVWSDNTQEGKDASNEIKTMLQYHADVLGLKRKLGVLVRHWSIYFIGVLKHGYSIKKNDITLEVRQPKNFVLDPDGYIDEFGNYIGDYLGERIKTTAKKLVDLYPKQKDYITLKVDGKMGTTVIYTEWWTDEYTFSTYEDVVLDKSKNPFFAYDTEEEVEDEYGFKDMSVTPGRNHFSAPKMPYTFLSVFSLQETPHDTTNLIEQSIPNQDRITERDAQITKNLKNGNNSIALSGQSFDAETARQAAVALENGDPVLVPDGQVDTAIKRFPANPVPPGVFDAQNIDKDTLRGVFGTNGLAPQQMDENTTARGMILNQSHDSTRIGGGIGDSLEQLADNVFNWWLQMYFVFYDEAHYGAIMGNGKAVEYVQLINTNMIRNFVVSVSPNSMQPKDEISRMNIAIERWNNKAIDPLSFMKEINDPDPMEAAKQLTMWIVNPQQYMMTYFPEVAPPPLPPGAGAPNPPDAPGVPLPADESLAASPASPALNQVPLNNPPQQ